jgi:hypothetical protein
MREARSGLLSAAGLDGRDALFAKRAILRLVSGDIERQQRDSSDSQIHPASASVYDRSCAPAIPPGSCHRFDRFAGRASRSHDVFDHEGALAGLDSETSAQCHYSILAFSKKRAAAQRACRFVSDYDPADSGRDHDTDLFIPEKGSDMLSDAFGVPGVLKHESALQISGRVQPGGEQEMAFEHGSGFLKDRKQIVFFAAGFRLCLFHLEFSVLSSQFSGRHDQSLTQ